MKINKNWSSVAIGVTALLCPAIAFAADTSMFNPPDTDVSMKILKSIFGSALGEGGADPFGNLFRVLNSAALFIMGVMASYTIIMGTLHTAHDGEALGKKWSSIWVPLNLALFTSMLMPLPSGYNTGEIAYMWVVKQGVGIGDTAWTAYIDGQTDSQISVARPQVTELVSKTLLTLTCVETSKKIVATVPEWIGTPVGAQANGNRVFYNSHTAIAGCGSVDFGKLADAVDPGFFDKLGVTVPAPSPVSIVLSHRRAYTQLVTDLTPIAKGFASATGTGIADKLSVAAAKYQKTVMDAVQVYGQEGHNLVSTASATDQKKDGWIMAGFWYMALARTQSIAAENAAHVPIATQPTTQLSDVSTNKSAVETQAYAKEQLRLSEDANSMGITNTSGAEDDSEIQKWMAKIFTGVDLDNLDASGRHPILFIADLGDRFINIGLTLITGLGTISVLAATPFVGAGVQAFLTVVSPIASTFMVLSSTIGFTLSYFIPALPAIIWTGAIVGYFVFVIEGMIGVTLLIVASASPDQDGVIGKHGQAYMLILKALIYPFLMVFGFVVSLVLVDVLFGQFLNKIFVAYLHTTNHGLKSMIAAMAGAIIYCVLVITLLKKIFEMVHVIPDQVLRYIGGSQSSDLGSHASQASGSMNTAVIAASTQIGHVGGNVKESAAAIAKAGGKKEIKGDESGGERKAK